MGLACAALTMVRDVLRVRSVARGVGHRPQRGLGSKVSTVSQLREIGPYREDYLNLDAA
ncbi:hypothetical protein ABIE38_000357 [Dietzia sp. 2505]